MESSGFVRSAEPEKPQRRVSSGPLSFLGNRRASADRSPGAAADAAVAAVDGTPVNSPGRLGLLSGSRSSFSATFLGLLGGGGGSRGDDPASPAARRRLTGGSSAAGSPAGSAQPTADVHSEAPGGADIVLDTAAGSGTLGIDSSWSQAVHNAGDSVPGGAVLSAEGQKAAALDLEGPSSGAAPEGADVLPPGEDLDGVPGIMTSVEGEPENGDDDMFELEGESEKVIDAILSSAEPSPAVLSAAEPRDAVPRDALLIDDGTSGSEEAERSEQEQGVAAAVSEVLSPGSSRGAIPFPDLSTLRLTDSPEAKPPSERLGRGPEEGSEPQGALAKPDVHIPTADEDDPFPPRSHPLTSIGSSTSYTPMSGLGSGAGSRPASGLASPAGGSGPYAGRLYSALSEAHSLLSSEPSETELVAAAEARPGLVSLREHFSTASRSSFDDAAAAAIAGLTLDSGAAPVAAPPSVGDVAAAAAQTPDGAGVAAPIAAEASFGGAEIAAATPETETGTLGDGEKGANEKIPDPKNSTVEGATVGDFSVEIEAEDIILEERHGGPAGELEPLGPRLPSLRKAVLGAPETPEDLVSAAWSFSKPGAAAPAEGTDTPKIGASPGVAAAAQLSPPPPAPTAEVESPAAAAAAAETAPGGVDCSASTSDSSEYSAYLGLGDASSEQGSEMGEQHPSKFARRGSMHILASRGSPVGGSGSPGGSGEVGGVRDGMPESIKVACISPLLGTQERGWVYVTALGQVFQAGQEDTAGAGISLEVTN